MSTIAKWNFRSAAAVPLLLIAIMLLSAHLARITDQMRNLSVQAASMLDDAQDSQAGSESSLEPTRQIVGSIEHAREENRLVLIVTTIGTIFAALLFLLFASGSLRTRAAVFLLVVVFESISIVGWQVS